MSEPVACKLCGAEIVFAIGPAGKQIPLARVAQVYVLSGDGHAELAMAAEEKWISHFVDCWKIRKPKEVAT